MLSENTQLRQSYLNDSIHSYAACRQAEIQNIHAHVHEYGVITLKNSIEADAHVRVHVRWSMYGNLNLSTMGTWHVSAALESLQGGNIQRIPLPLGASIPLTPRHGPVDYETWVMIPANTVTFTEDERTKSYKLVVTVVYCAPVAQPVPPTSGVADLTFQSHVVLVTPLIYRAPTGFPGPLTGIMDGPDLQFYIVA